MSNPDDDVERLSADGLSLLDARDFVGARERLVRAVAIAPKNPTVHYRMGIFFNEAGQPAQALACFESAVALDPRDFRIHNNRGSTLQMLGRMDEAEAAFRRAISIQPDSDIPRLNLGKLLEFTGRSAQAADVYREGMALGANVAAFAHNLAALRGQRTSRAPDAWVVATFDSFAPTFERHLRSLGYDAPDQLARMIDARVVSRSGGDFLDLGCGTGLCGKALARPGRRFVGVDLSTQMLAHARALGIYESLAAEEIHAYLRRCPAGSFDIVVAADVLIYVGDVGEMFTQIWRVLRRGGCFAFSTEESDAETYRLTTTGRYAQSERYIRTVTSASFSVLAADEVVLRHEVRMPVAGRLWLLQRYEAT